MKKNVFLLLVLLTAFVSICSNDDSNDATTTPISFGLVGKGALFGNGAEGIVQSNLVITNQTDWQNLMDAMDTVNNTSSHFTETNIDFSQYTVIAIFLEIKGWGYDFEISSIEETADNIVVSKTDPLQEASTAVINQPFHIVKIPITTKPIVFN